MKTLIVTAALAFLAPPAARACEDCDMHKGDHHEHAKATTAAAAPAAAAPAAAPLAANEARVTIPISGMHCGHCADRVKTALEGVQGVKSVDANLEKGQAVVAFEKEKVKSSKLVETIDALGFKAGQPVQN